MDAKICQCVMLVSIAMAICQQDNHNGKSLIFKELPDMDSNHE